MKSWQDSVPEGMTTSLHQLKVWHDLNMQLIYYVMPVASLLHVICNLLCINNQSIVETKMYKGIALTDMSATPPAIWFYPVTALPQDATERWVWPRVPLQCV